MDSAGFRASLLADGPPAALSAPLAALWWDARGDWERAHDGIALDEIGRSAAWVHAYLHRKEGDTANARYWYGRAGRPVATASLTVERDAILTTLLSANGRAA